MVYAQQEWFFVILPILFLWGVLSFLLTLFLQLRNNKDLQTLGKQIIAAGQAFVKRYLLPRFGS